MSDKRKDHKGRPLKVGESQRKIKERSYQKVRYLITK